MSSSKLTGGTFQRSSKHTKTPSANDNSKHLLSQSPSKDIKPITMKPFFHDLPSLSQQDRSNIDKIILPENLSPLRTDRTRELKLMEYSTIVSPPPIDKDSPVSIPKKNTFAAFDYVLDGQKDELQTAVNHAISIIDELLTNGSSCHKKISQALPHANGGRHVVIKSPKSGSVKNQHHDVVKKLLEFWDIFELIVNDIRGLQQNMLYHINQNTRMKDSYEREKQAMEDKYLVYFNQQEAKGKSLENLKSKYEYEIRQLKCQIEERTSENVKLSMERDLLLRTLHEKSEYIASIEDMEKHYLRAAKSIVNKNNLSVSQREVKLQQSMAELSELGYWKAQAQTIKNELSTANRSVKQLESIIKRMSNKQRSSSPKKASHRVAPKPEENNSDVKEEALIPSCPMHDEEVEYANIKPQRSEKTTSEESNAYLVHKNRALTKQNAELKEQVADLSTKLARARAHPISSIHFVAEPDNECRSPRNIVQRNALIARPRSALGIQSTSSALGMSIKQDRCEVVNNPYFSDDDGKVNHSHDLGEDRCDSEYVYEDVEDESSEKSNHSEEDRLEAEAEECRKQRRKEIIRMYEEKIKYNSTRIPAEASDVRKTVRFQQIRENKNFSLYY